MESRINQHVQPKTVFQQFLEMEALAQQCTGPCQHHNRELVLIGGFEVQKCTACGQITSAVGFADEAVHSHSGTVAKDTAQPQSAVEFLDSAKHHMQDRATTYDSPEGERSMETVVNMFNELKGTDLTVTDGWEFMAILKLVRANQGAFRSDNYEDMVAYVALAGEQAVLDNAPRVAEMPTPFNPMIATLALQ